MRLLCSLFIAIALMAVFSAAQAPDTGSIRGRVVRAGTTEGLSKATVELIVASVGTLSDFEFNPAILQFAKTRSGFRSATTNERGEFIFEKIPAGRYRVEALRDSFSHASSPAIDVQDGAQVQNVRVAMSPAAAITGIVRDENDRPVVRASVTAVAVSYRPGGGRQLRAQQSVETNDRGEYRLYWLAPGEYYVSVDYSENAMSNIQTPRQNTVRPEKDYPLFYYPGTREVENAKAVRVRESGLDVGGIDIRLQRAAMYTIRGTVLTSGINLSPLPTINLMLTPASFPDANPGFRYQADSSGKFEIKDVAPGSYLLQAWGSSRAAAGPALHSATHRIEVGSKDLEGLAIPTILSPEIKGRVRIDGAETTRLPFETAAIALKFVGRVGQGTGLYGGDSFNGFIGADGTYSTTRGAGAYPGEFDITMPGLPAEYYVKEPLTLQVPGTEVPPAITADLIIGRHRGVASGIVTGADSRPAVGATVVLVPAEKFQRRLDRYPRASTDAEGRFRIVSTPPGDYTAYAFEGIVGDAQYNPAFLQAYPGRGGRVSIVENADASLNLRLIPMERQ